MAVPPPVNVECVAEGWCGTRSVQRGTSLGWTLAWWTGRQRLGAVDFCRNLGLGGDRHHRHGRDTFAMVIVDMTAVLSMLLAAGGTLGILIPPSIPMIVFGFVAEESVIAFFLAGIDPVYFWLLLLASP